MNADVELSTNGPVGVGRRGPGDALRVGLAVGRLDAPVCRRAGETPQRHGGRGGVVQDVRAVWAFPYVRAPLISGDGPRRHLGQRIAEEATREAVTARQRDHRHIGAMVVLGRRTARGIEVQRVRDSEGRGVCEVPVVNRLVVIESREDVELQAVGLRRVRPDRALGGRSTRRNVDLARPDGGFEDMPKVGRGGRTARTPAAGALAAAGQDEGRHQQRRPAFHLARRGCNPRVSECIGGAYGLGASRPGRPENAGAGPLPSHPDRAREQTRTPDP